MTAAGIVAEYNPFHPGHAYHIAQTRRLLGEDAAILCVMSGNFVQRGECAVFDKWTRARMALEGGADLVLELPTVWAVSSAEGFARGAVSILAAAGVLSHLSFGSECGDAEALSRLSACLDSPDFTAALRRRLDRGLPFAACRQGAAEELVGKDLAGLLAFPNNNLGVEYIRALDRLGSAIRPVTVRRAGAGHDGGDHPDFPSASFLRRRLLEETPSPDAASLQYGERWVLGELRRMGEEAFAALPDCGEGLSHRLFRASRQGRSLEDVYSLAKTKRYAHARVRRAVLWGALGLREGDRPESPPYLRVLGLNSRGREVLREMKSRSSAPVLTKPAHIARLGPEARALFALEERCTDLYGLCFPTPRSAGWEKQRSPVVL